VEIVRIVRSSQACIAYPKPAVAEPQPYQSKLLNSHGSHRGLALSLTCRVVWRDECICARAASTVRAASPATRSLRCKRHPGSF
jgi:hypothetical protein